MDCSLPGSSVHSILQTRILQWVAIPFSRESSPPRDQTRPLALQTDSLPSEPPGKKYSCWHLNEEIKKSILCDKQNIPWWWNQGFPNYVPGNIGPLEKGQWSNKFEGHFILEYSFSTEVISSPRRWKLDLKGQKILVQWFVTLQNSTLPNKIIFLVI